MRTRPSLFRRLRNRGEESPREYEASAIIRIRADTKSFGYDLTETWQAHMERINKQFPWLDTENGKTSGCEFEWNRREECFRVKVPLALRKGQWQAFEKYIQNLCTHLENINTFAINVFHVEGRTTFTKVVHNSRYQ